MIRVALILQASKARINAGTFTDMCMHILYENSQLHDASASYGRHAAHMYVCMCKIMHMVAVYMYLQEWKANNLA